MADARDDSGEAGFADQRVEIADIAIAPLGVAGQDIAHVLEPARFQQARRLDQQFLAFPSRQPRRQQHDPFVRRDAPRGAQPRHPRGIDGGCREGRKVRAAMHHLDARPSLRVEPFDHGGGEAGIGDDDVAARHDRIVAQLERRSSAIGAVERGDEGAARQPAGGQPDPGGGARAGMQQVDALGGH